MLCDDGLQHYALARDMELVVIDGERGLGNGQLLPQGPLREMPSRLDSVDLMVVNGINMDSSAQLAAHSYHPMSLEPDAWLAVGQIHGEVPQPPQKIHALAGIGNPVRFFNALEQQGFQVVAHAFSDLTLFRP